MGLESGSDCSVWRINSDTAIVQSVDFFTPVVDDPYEFGQIAAANSLSDIYAVGARPITAMNIVCFPIKERGRGELEAILRGGLEKIKEAGAVLAGGHSVEDPEPKYGLSVTGLVHPDRFLSNKGARPGDALVLTKPLGTGILATAHKAGLLEDTLLDRMIRVMKTLNKDAAELMCRLGAHAATDITGFGLAGHALEMARASGCRMVIQAQRLPLLEKAIEFLQMGMIPEGDYANMNFCKRLIEIDEAVDEALIQIIFDAQTSGGLLIAIGPREAGELVARLRGLGHEEAAIIGQAEAMKEGEDAFLLIE